ncbi:MAG: hypothetical protein ACREGF_03325 [Candidatus Saccharimonadales bacterium]
MSQPELYSQPQSPGFDFDFNARPEQQTALQVFLDFVQSIDAGQVDKIIAPGLKIYGKNPEVVNETADYLRANPAGFAVLSLWQNIQETNAAKACSFDPTTETVIDQDAENQRLLGQLGSKIDPVQADQIRAAIIRNRFAIFARRAAANPPNKANHAA